MSLDDLAPATATAVVLYGPPAACEASAASLIRHVVAPCSAALFYTVEIPVPRADGYPDGSELPRTPPVALPAVYGEYLVDSDVWEGPSSDDLNGASRRIVSDMRGLQRGLELLEACERRTGKRFDRVVIARTDTIFYGPVTAAVQMDVVQVARGEGFDAVTGRPLRDTARLWPFRTPATGDLVPDDGSARFSASLMVFPRTALELLHDIADKVRFCLDDGVPAHAATILYVLLVLRGGLRVERRADWIIETWQADAVPSLRAAVEVAGPPREARRVAVLLHGPLRAAKATAGSLLRHVVEAQGASVFRFGVNPEFRDDAFDTRGAFVFGTQAGAYKHRAPDPLLLYGRWLRAVGQHEVPQRHFIDMSETLCSREEWLFSRSPHRILSMFHDMAGAIALLEDHERTTGDEFDTVVLTRPDVSFYAPVTTDPAAGEMHVASGEGFDPNGFPRCGTAPVFYYKNAATGSYLPAGQELHAEDGLICVTRADLRQLGDIYASACALLKQRVPASAASILYAMADRASLKVVTHADWLHEVREPDQPITCNVIDTPNLARIDPHHPRAW